MPRALHKDGPLESLKTAIGRTIQATEGTNERVHTFVGNTDECIERTRAQYSNRIVESTLQIRRRRICDAHCKIPARSHSSWENLTIGSGPRIDLELETVSVLCDEILRPRRMLRR